MKYLIYDTQAAAIAAEAEISSAMGYSKPGVNAATGEIDQAAITTRWAIPEQIADGRWVFPSPDDSGVEASADWWPSMGGGA